MVVGLASASHMRETGWISLIAVAMTGAIGVLQFLAPGRHARLMDFVVDALAACVGLAAAAALDWAIRRTRPQP